MSAEQGKTPRRAPGRFVTEQQIKTTARKVAPVARSRMNRYDSKEVIERDMERERGAARRRLQGRGVEIPESLRARDANGGDPDFNAGPDTGRDAGRDFDGMDASMAADMAAGMNGEIENSRDVSAGVMTGPKPIPPQKVTPVSAADVARERNMADTGNATPGRFFASKAALDGGGRGAMGGAEMGGNPAGNSGSGATANTASRNVNANANANANAGANAGAGAAMEAGGNPASIHGRVDELRATTTQRSSNVDLPDTSVNWRRHDQVRSGENTGAPSGRHRASRRSTAGTTMVKPARQKLRLEKILPRIGGYMIAAVAVGYILVLTYYELRGALH